MGLPKGNGADNARDYLKGAIAGGGLWHALEVLDDAVLQSSVSTLNDVTLTSPNIGAAEWTDAQHTHASAATAGSTLGPGTTLSTPTLQTPAVSGVMTFGGDATLQRTGAGLLGLTGAWHAPSGTWDVKTGAAPGTTRLSLAQTGTLTLTPDATAQALAANGYCDILAPGGGYHMLRGWVAGVQKFVFGGNGTLTLSPDAGQSAWAATLGGTTLGVAAGGLANSAQLTSTAGPLLFYAGGGSTGPASDNTFATGFPGNRWASVYAVSGIVNTSAAEAKQAITPLDPAAALAAVLATDPVVFDYRPPERDPTYYELPDDPEQAESVLQQRLSSSPLEAAARHQAGFVLQDATGQYQTDPLFETGQGQSNAANSVGVLLAALHDIDARLTALEAPGA